MLALVEVWWAEGGAGDEGVVFGVEGLSQLVAANRTRFCCRWGRVGRSWPVQGDGWVWYSDEGGLSVEQGESQDVCKLQCCCCCCSWLGRDSGADESGEEWAWTLRRASAAVGTGKSDFTDVQLQLVTALQVVSSLLSLLPLVVAAGSDSGQLLSLVLGSSWQHCFF